MVTTTAIPRSIVSRIRTQLHHSKRHGRPRKSMPMSAGTNKWIYQRHELQGLGRDTSNLLRVCGGAYKQTNHTHP